MYDRGGAAGLNNGLVYIKYG
jgi:hypothetical protein